MLIRGANSLTGSTAPLIVLDGFPLFDVSTSTGGGIDGYDTGMSSLSMINPDDIASIEVLKDAEPTESFSLPPNEAGATAERSNTTPTSDFNR